MHRVNSTIVLIIGSLCVSVGVLANAPIVSASSQMYSAPALSTSARLTQVENKLHYLVNLDQKIDNVQGKLDTLRGQIETTNFKLSQLQVQQRRDTQKIATLSAALSKAKKGVSSSVSSSVKQSDKAAYYAAYAFVKKKQYHLASKAYRKFLTDYPKTLYRYSANYWLGELASMDGDVKAAKRYYQRVLSNPKSYRAKDAMTKLAMIYVIEGNKTKAKRMFSDIVDRFKGTNAANNAKIQLKKLKT